MQFAMDPDTEDIIVIEINPGFAFFGPCVESHRLSQKLQPSWPLAIISTSYPTRSPEQLGIFRAHARYVIVIPKWNFDKFHGADRSLSK